MSNDDAAQSGRLPPVRRPPIREKSAIVTAAPAPRAKVELPPLQPTGVWSGIVTAALYFEIATAAFSGYQAVVWATKTSLTVADRHIVVLFYFANFAGLLAAGVGGMAFIAWLYLSHTNLKVLHAKEQAFSSMTGAVMMFIPGLNFLVALAMMRDLIGGSDPNNIPLHNRRGRPAKPDLLYLWFACGVVNLCVVAYCLATAWVYPQVTPESFVNRLMVVAFANATTIASAACLIKLVGRINANQKLRYEYLSLYGIAPALECTSLPEYSEPKPANLPMQNFSE